MNETTPQAGRAELPAMIARLVETLRQELRQHQRLLGIVRQKKETSPAGSIGEMDLLLKREREVVTDMVTVERDRIALVAELGFLLGHPNPARLRIAELVLHAPNEERDELLDLRDEFRDVADELDDLNQVEPRFSRLRQENVRVYASPSRCPSLSPLPPGAGVRPAPRGAPAGPRGNGA